MKRHSVALPSQGEPMGDRRSLQPLQRVAAFLSRRKFTVGPLVEAFQPPYEVLLVRKRLRQCDASAALPSLTVDAQLALKYDGTEIRDGHM